MLIETGKHIINFLYYNFYRYRGAHNWGLPSHIIIMLIAFLLMPLVGIDGFWKWTICIVAAIVLECLEFIFEHEGQLDIAYLDYDINYNDGMEKYWYDTIGDVTLPLLLCLAVEMF